MGSASSGTPTFDLSANVTTLTDAYEGVKAVKKWTAGRYDMLLGEAGRFRGRPTSRRILPMNASLTGAEFKNQLRAGGTKMGLFLNSHSPTLAEQFAHSGYDWLLVDTQHGPIGNDSLSAMLAGWAAGGATAGYASAATSDRGVHPAVARPWSDGVSIPYINSADEARRP